MNWETNTYGPMPYYNYKGELITEINNTYVDGLIELGIHLPDGGGPKSGGSREELYEELMDIFYAECWTVMQIQATGRHWERDWLQGWFYNPIRPGYYFYDLWKEDPATVKRDLGLYALTYMVHMDIYNSYVYKWIKIVNHGVTWEFYRFIEWIFVNGAIVHFEVITGWLRPGGTLIITKSITVPQGYCFSIGVIMRVHIFNWIRCEWYLDPVLYGIPEETELNNDYPSFASGGSYLGDLGGGLPPAFGAFDGLVDGKDLSLFLRLFGGEKPYYYP